ncbi:MAG: hypothetical protein JSR55_09060 [Proteobacteria bacterium]|nr:hypothetical protein [Pseudomonadota bacterium]
MRVIALITGLLLFASTQTSLAEEAGKPDTKLGTSVEMPYLIAPLSSGDSLLAYAYVSCKIVGASQAAAIEIQAKVPFIQDAFVRDVNASTIGKPGDPMAVDKATLEPRLLALAKKVMGPGKVVDLKLMEVQIRPMRPMAAPPATSPS